MSLELLDKTRVIYGLLNAQATERISFRDFCEVLSDQICANVMLVSRKGKVLGMKTREDIQAARSLDGVSIGGRLDALISERLLHVLSTQENVNLMTLGMTAEEAGGCRAMVAPVSMAGKRLGTLLVYRQSEPFLIDDIILAEYGMVVIGLAMQRAESEETAAEQQKEQDVKDAMRSLSKLELQAMLYVLERLGGRQEGMVITSRLSEQVGITRSVIVNGIRKCESAGIIRTKSAGMKGTRIFITNDIFQPELVRRCIQDQF